MLAELKFVQGAVARKELIPTLTHFRIENGCVRSFNGTLALCSPIQFDIDCTPKAIPFVKAIQNCTETVTMAMTKAGRLSVKSGSFSAFIDCVEEETPHVEPEGEFFEIDGESFLKALKTIHTVIGNDASRPWTNGVLLYGQSAFATNNIVLAEYWIGGKFPVTCNIPKSAVKEILRINEPPVKIQATENSISFHYNDGRWIRTSLLDLDWPDLTKILNVETNLKPINNKIFEGLEIIKPFADKMGRVYFHKNYIKTSMEDNDGASFDIEEEMEGVYQIEMLSLLKNIANKADFTLYPKPVIFHGENVRGAIIGMRV